MTALATRSIAVVLGGPSPEHDVSLMSGRAIANALAGQGHEVSGWLVDLERQWWSLPPAALGPEVSQEAFHDPPSLEARGPFSAAGRLRP